MAEDLGDRIRARRRRRGWTLKDLAQASRLSVPYLSDLERRQGVNPSLDVLEAVARGLGCDVADLVGGQGELPSPPPPSLDRFLRSEEFRRQVDSLAKRAYMPPEEVVLQLTNFLAAAPRRSTGDLTAHDWRRLLDVFWIITEDR